MCIPVISMGIFSLKRDLGLQHPYPDLQGQAQSVIHSHVCLVVSHTLPA